MQIKKPRKLCPETKDLLRCEMQAGHISERHKCGPWAWVQVPPLRTEPPHQRPLQAGEYGIFRVEATEYRMSWHIRQGDWIDLLKTKSGGMAKA